MAESRERRPRTRGPGFVLEGEPGGFRLELSVDGYEFPGTVTGSDAEWLLASLELRSGGIRRAQLENDPFLRRVELAAFRDELRALLAGHADRAGLETLEDMIEIEIERRAEGLSLAATVTNHGNLDVQIDRIRVEVATLEAVEADLDRMLEQFPSRPEPRVRRLEALPARPKLGDFLRRRDR